MFEKIGRFSVRFRWFIIAFWILLVPIVSSAFPKITDVTKNNTSDFLSKNSGTSQAAHLETAFQSKDTATSAAIIASRNGTQLSGADLNALNQMVAKVEGVKDITQVRSLGISADGQAKQYQVGISAAAFGQESTNIVNNIRSAIHSSNLPAGLQANLTGSLPAGVDQEKANSKGRNSTEIYTVILILALLLLVFRALLAPIVTLIPAGLALAVSQPIIAESTKFGVEVGFITQILLIVLLLGAGTDYGLFLVFRTREELQRGLEPKEAVVKAISRVGESITFSAATVIAALLSLLLATFGLYKGLGPALAIGLVTMLLIALTFLPALLAVLGRKVFWPSKTIKRDLKIGIWGKIADNAIKKPVVILVLGVFVFGTLSLGLIGYKTSGFGNQSAPAGSDSAMGQQALKQHFPAANNEPELLIFKFPTSVWNDLTIIQTTQTKLTESGQFKDISGPFNVNGFTLTAEQLQVAHAAGPDSPINQAISQFISPDGQTIQYYAILKAGPTGSTAATSAIPTIRNELNKVAKEVGAETSQVYSSDSAAYDINKTAINDLKKIIPVVLLIIAVLLAILLRSLVAPWYLIATVGLSYVASLGFAMIVFVHLGHQDGLNFVLPFLMFIFGMALGEDYNILVMSRIREEAHGNRSLKTAVTKAIGITGTTVTSAGLILAGTFTILGIVGGGEQTQQIGFGIAFGILLDTFFVRTLLVPSIVALLGRYNWWPSELYRNTKA